MNGEKRIVGLGASDMKSGLATMMHVVEHFHQTRLNRLRTVVSFTICEEAGAKDPKKKRGVLRVINQFPAGWAITTEPSFVDQTLTLGVGSQGFAVIRVKLRGKSAHSSTPELGLNAIHAAGLIAQRVAALNDSFKEIEIVSGAKAKASIAVTQINGGIASNIIPEKCDITISRRLVPSETVETVKNEVSNLTSNLNCVQAEWKISCDALACSTNPKGVLMQSAERASHQVLEKAICSWNRGRTDQVVFHQAGMDTINIGPGSMSQAHVSGEYVLLRNVHASANLLAQTILNLDRSLTSESHLPVERKRTSANLGY
jgi:succinyl-diaminopimelate desuccinylase